MLSVFILCCWSGDQQQRRHSFFIYLRTRTTAENLGENRKGSGNWLRVL